MTDELDNPFSGPSMKIDTLNACVFSDVNIPSTANTPDLHQQNLAQNGNTMFKKNGSVSTLFTMILTSL